MRSSPSCCCARRRGLDDAGLAAELGCDQLQLARLMLCRQPRDAHFAADLARMAGRIGLDRLALARVLCLAAALESLVETAAHDEGLRAARRAEEDDAPDEEPEQMLNPAWIDAAAEVFWAATGGPPPVAARPRGGDPADIAARDRRTPHFAPGRD